MLEEFLMEIPGYTNLKHTLETLTASVPKTGDTELSELVKAFKSKLVEWDESAADYLDRAKNLARERDYRNVQLDLHNVSIALVHFGEWADKTTKIWLRMAKLDNPKIN